jgi:hypothetical protein
VLHMLPLGEAEEPRLLVRAVSMAYANLI